MKKYFYILVFFIFVFSCKNEEKQNIISADPSAKIRKTPHQNGEELLTLNKGTAIEIIGVSSHKDKITIAGKEIEDYWYLIAKDTIIKENYHGGGWVFGGCINFSKKNIKQFISTLNAKDLIGNRVYLAPCFNGYDSDKNPDCGTDCDTGSIDFIDDNLCTMCNYCIGTSQNTYLANYAIKDNKLIITFLKKYIEETDNEDDNSHYTFAAPIIKTLEKARSMTFEIHFYGNQPVFTPTTKEGYWSSVPSNLVSEKHTLELQKMVLGANKN